MYTNKFKFQKAHAYPGKEKLKGSTTIKAKQVYNINTNYS